MTQLRSKKISWSKSFAIMTVFMLAGSAGAVTAAAQAKPWTAPASATAQKNPVPASAEAIKAGAGLYTDYCVACHGDKGKGDGAGAAILSVKPADFTNAKVMGAETDGAIFWKIGTGRSPMPGWADALSETERWQLVHYIRKLTKDAAGAK